jgi:hypothetical protein
MVVKNGKSCRISKDLILLLNFARFVLTSLGILIYLEQENNIIWRSHENHSKI